MPDDLPIYSDSTPRSRLRLADLENRSKRVDCSPVWVKSDAMIEKMEGARDVARARSSIAEPAKDALLNIHAVVFSNRDGAGRLRTTAVDPLYRGHDCPAPEFIDRSLDNLFDWLTAESFAEIYPVEKTGFVLARIIDIWPFEFGNLTAAMILANLFLRDAGLPPFFIRPEHISEFHAILGQAISIETQPLVNAIHQTIEQELETLAR